MDFKNFRQFEWYREITFKLNKTQSIESTLEIMPV